MMRYRAVRILAKPGVRLAIAVLLVAATVPVVAPPAMGAADDDLPGVAMPASPITGTLSEAADYDDVYAVYLNTGQSITVALKGPGNADFDLYLYPPGSTDMMVDPLAADSSASGSVELLNYTAEGPGTYYLDVYAYSGAGGYTLAWRVENEVAGLYVTPMEGVGRIETAIMSARTAFPEGSEYVIIATARSFPDALGGSALAGVLDAPVLLTEPTALPAAVATEIVENLGATRAIILGGTGAVSQAVEDGLNDMPGDVNVERIGGANRYETARKIANRVVNEIALLGGERSEGPYVAFVATGQAFPDALSASSWGSTGSVPFFLVNPSTDPAGLVESLMAVNVDRVYILGGTGAVPQAVQTATEKAGITTLGRLAGRNRYETAAAIAYEYGVDLSVAVTTGLDFPDALAGGAALGRYGVPILLTRPTALEPAAKGVLEAHGRTIEDVFFLGGTVAVSVPVRAAVRGTISGTWGPSSLGGGSASLSAALRVPVLDPVKSNRP
ncbi:MAG: cell wall-binding repeat-containing protein [Actinomycetota bacterium]